MVTRLRFLSCFLLISIFALQGYSQSASADKKLTRSKARVLIKSWLKGGKNADSAWKTLVDSKKTDYRTIWQAIEKGVFIRSRKSRKAGTFEFELEANKNSPKGTYIVSVPKTYKGNKPFPVVFRFHGPGGRASDHYGSYWHPKPYASKFISVSPTVPTENRRDWGAAGVLTFIDRIYRKVLIDFNVDTNRVYFSGMDNSSAASSMYPQIWPHRTAGFIARGNLYPWINGYWNYSLDCLQYVPGMFIVGLKDKEKSLREFRDVEKIHKDKGYKGQFHYLPGRACECSEEFRNEAYKFLLKQQRVQYPKEIRCRFVNYPGSRNDSLVSSQSYWIKRTDRDHRIVILNATINGNTILLRSKQTMKGEIYLNDRLVDMDKEITILMDNGRGARTVFKGKVPRSIPFLLEQLKETRDTSLLYWNKVPVNL